MKIHGLGRLTTRNRKFLKKVTPYGSKNPMADTSVPTDSRIVPDPTDSRIVPDPASMLPTNQQHITTTEQEDVQLSDQVEDTVTQQAIRSSRARHEPERLNIATTRGKTYESE